MTALLDANVRIALVVTEHVHHDAAADGYRHPIQDLRCARSHNEVSFDSWCREGYPRDVVSAVETANRHEFWPDSASFAEVEIRV